MEGAEDIYVNRGLTPKKKVKKKEATAGAQRFREEDEPDYENISRTTRNQNGVVEQQSMSVQWAPAASAPSNSSGLSSAHKSVMSLYILLALSFLLCIILLSLVVVKSSDFSGELLSVKRELLNVSSILHKEQHNVERLETMISQINETCDKLVKKIEKDLRSNRVMLNSLNTRVQNLEKTQNSGPSPTHSTG
ncbi:mast cell-expressed membrane protein 1 [Petaurus breviceps papuanus]|uniref:mast cell-expressed membrane protein 1 n=1 Tax=Petaurus breviceps papuanus TaxID=3040969 RepID=UPI0036DA4207